MTTTQHTTETATALLSTRKGMPPLNEADEKEISRIIDLFDGATDDQDGALEAHLKAFRTEAQARAYERVAAKLESWAATAAILGQVENACEYEDLAEVQREMAEAVRLIG